MRPKKGHNRERGAAAVEFALVLPFLVLLLGGIIELGFLFYDKQMIANASRAGARTGITWASPAEINQVVVDACSSRLPGGYPGDRLMTFDPVKPLPQTTVTGGGAFQNDLNVTVSYVYDLLFPSLLGMNVEENIDVTTTMKMERSTAE